MAKLLLGKEVNTALNWKSAERVNSLKAAGITPVLAIVRVGAREDDLYYERGAEKRCAQVGIEVRKVTFETGADTEQLTAAVKALSADPAVHGVLILRPLPDGIDERAVCEALSPEKDVDGVTTASSASVYQGRGPGFAPCTACSVMEILKYYGIALRSRRAVVVGRSLVIGKPVAMMLLGADATVTVCHSRSGNLSELCRGADIVVASAGRAKMLTGEYFSPGQTVIDVGINTDSEGNLCGDVDTAAVERIVDAITPVPGGVGSVTTSVLAAHVAEAAERLSGGADHAMRRVSAGVKK